MKGDISVTGVIKTSIVTAFTVVAALIWQKVITDSIHQIFPESQQLFYNFVVAVIVTVLVALTLIIILKAESKIKKVKR